MAMTIDTTRPITTGDTSVGVVYTLIDSMGSPWWSSPMIRTALRADSTEASSPIWQFLRIPTLRHLMPGTTAQIEIYLGQTDLEQFRVLPNDPTVDYIDFSPDGAYSPDVGTMKTLAQAIDLRAAEGPMPVIYTNGNALANDPPPVARCLTVWRSRCIACEGNNVRVSQEFADGIGFQWNNVTRVTWNEGTGDIIAACAIDWNYLAVFKRDAVGVISGPGPDGLGHGNYIVQTLLTKMGCTNPKSVVNGADGCYFQDAATGRLAIVTPQLQTSELAPGWFNSEGAAVTCALQVESRRQVWLSTDDGQVIALDYKHKTDRCPFGQAFVWQLSEAFGNVVAMCIVGDTPYVAFEDGRLGRYVDGTPYDLAADGTETAILRKFRTGDMNPAKLQQQIDVTRVQFLGEFQSPHSLTLDVIPNSDESSDPATIEVEDGPEQFAIRPPNCQRIHAVAFDVEEGEIDGADMGAGFKFIGFAIEFQDWGKVAEVGTERIL